MAKEAFIVSWDIQSAGPGFDAEPEYKKSTTGKTTGKTYQLKAATKMPFGQVFQTLTAEVEAESVEEAGIVAREAFGISNGLVIGAKASSVEAKEV